MRHTHLIALLLRSWRGALEAGLRGDAAFRFALAVAALEVDCPESQVLQRFVRSCARQYPDAARMD
jgi:hypothetical protein